MGNNNVKDMVKVDIDGSTFKKLQEYYFKETKSGTTETISCGSKILDNYKETSRTDKCVQIANGDNYISAADLFIHHIFKSGLVPKNMRKHFRLSPNKDCGDNSTMFVGLPFIKWFLETNNIKVIKEPKIETDDHVGVTCPHIGSLKYYPLHLSAENKDFRRLAETGGACISKISLFIALEKWVVNSLDNDTVARK